MKQSAIHGLPCFIPKPDAPRLDAEGVGTIITCLVNKDEETLLTLKTSTGVRGKVPHEWIQGEAWGRPGTYSFVCCYTGGMITSILWMRTPSGREFDQCLDDGDPNDFISIPDCIALTHMMLGMNDTKDWGCELVPCWYLSTDDKRPYVAGLYFDKEQADKALVEQREYREKVITANAHRNRDEEREIKEKKGRIKKK